ncbi:GDSL-type esterase/lipase family protein [Streptomyces sp. NPDC005146]
MPGSTWILRSWLPQLADCDLSLLESDAELHTAALPSRPRWVHYGSSISQSAEAEGPTETWPAATAKTAQLNLTGLGFAGNAMLDPFVARTIRNLPVDFISLEIGTNIVEQAAMRRRTFLPAVHGFLDTIRETHPDTPILIISPIPCPVLENRPGPRYAMRPPAGQLEATGHTEDIPAGALTLTVVREQLQLLVKQRGQQDPALAYLDGRILLRPDETDDLHDGIHPNAAGYLRMGARLAQVLAEKYALSG